MAAQPPTVSTPTPGLVVGEQRASSLVGFPHQLEATFEEPVPTAVEKAPGRLRWWGAFRPRRGRGAGLEETLTAL